MFMKTKKYAFVRLGLGILFFGVAIVMFQKRLTTYFKKDKSPAGRDIETIYGTYHVTEPVLLDLIDSSAMQRLKKVHQFGVYYFIENGKPKEYTRYTHCLGVWALLKKYGASLEEQMAGLLHDASHTVFSHVGDYLFKQKEFNADSSYQDDIHAWYLQQQKVDVLLAKYGYTLEQVLPKKNPYLGLDQDLPNICADRLEYNLYEGVLDAMLDANDVQTILDDLKFEQGRWFFSSIEVAKKFAEVPLHLTAHHWGSAENFLLYSWAAKALKRAVELKIISFEDIHFSEDEIIWKKLTQSDDAIIKENLVKMNKRTDLFSVARKDTCDYLVKVKFRGINPWIKQGDSFKRLTELDGDFSQRFEKVKAQLTHGWSVTLLGEAEKDRGTIAQLIA